MKSSDRRLGICVIDMVLMSLRDCGLDVSGIGVTCAVFPLAEGGVDDGAEWDVKKKKTIDPQNETQCCFKTAVEFNFQSFDRVVIVCELGGSFIH